MKIEREKEGRRDRERERESCGWSLQERNKAEKRKQLQAGT